MSTPQEDLGRNPAPHTDPAALSIASQVNPLPSDLSFSSVMKMPLRIPPVEKHPYLDVLRPQDGGVEFLLATVERAGAQAITRIAGGCKGFSPEETAAFFSSTARGFTSPDGQRYFQGSIGSGGTRDFKADGEESVMVCQIPYYLARLYPCIAWGSTPQTYRLRMDAERGGSLVVSQYEAHLDPRGHHNVLTQTDATHLQDWNGDVRLYLDAMSAFQRRGYATALIVVNGGDVTMDEALLALTKNIPVIIMEGSRRAADTLAAAANGDDSYAKFTALYKDSYRRGFLDAEKDPVPSAEQLAKLVHVVKLDNPRTLSLAMDQLGLLSPPPPLTVAASA